MEQCPHPPAAHPGHTWLLWDRASGQPCSLWMSLGGNFSSDSLHSALQESIPIVHGCDRA